MKIDPREVARLAGRLRWDLRKTWAVLRAIGISSHRPPKKQPDRGQKESRR